MKLETLVGERFKEKPSEAVIDSHALMVRGGYIKPVTNGIYSAYPVMIKVIRKIENIIRKEMDTINGQEVLFPVVLPASLWQESGRYETVGKELLRFIDRNNSSMLLGMTHEEAAVHLVREYANSYTKYPFMIYQIQTKFRDELRPRGGLLRVREFTMKDGYSFHTSEADLHEYFMKCFHAYERIFSTVGLTQVQAFSSDSGMMGGNTSYEFMLPSSVGEDTIVTCSRCDYKANTEAAECITKPSNHCEQPLKKVYTKNMKTIEDVCGFLGRSVESSCKAVVYQLNQSDRYVIVFIRGDLDVNETKLQNFLKEEVHSADITEESGIIAGFIGPHNTDFISMLFDLSLENEKNLICGANEKDYHYVGFNIERDFSEVTYHDFATVKTGGICPNCGNESLVVSRGIELGHIFELGVKYTKAMNMTYSDKNGTLQYPVMGCYGIGIGRLAAAICETYHDEFGPIWPFSVAPWQVHICCLKSSDISVKETADSIYDRLISENIETIYDDRSVSAGVMFSDADLLGVPIKVIVSPRNIKEGLVEIQSRNRSFAIIIKTSEVVPTVKEMIHKLTENPSAYSSD